MCTCLDNAIQWNMCKHIHLVCRYMSKNDCSDNIQDSQNIPCSINHDNSFGDLIIDEKGNTTQNSLEKDLHVRNLKQKIDNTSLNEVKCTASALLQKLEQKVQCC